MKVEKAIIWQTPEFIKNFDNFLFKGTKSPKQIFEENREKIVNQFKK